MAPMHKDPSDSAHTPLRRRPLLGAGLATVFGLGLPAALRAATQAASAPAAFERLGSPQPFDAAWLKARARSLSSEPYVAPPSTLPPAIANLSWDQYQALQPRADHALWADQAGRFQLKFFHLGLFFKTPVRMHEVVGRQAQELAYDPAQYDFGKSGVDARKLPRDLGFAGFRVNFHTDWRSDVAAFLGASYFRAVGADKQYGLSARGLAIGTGAPEPEEFPVFTDYWFERPARDSDTLVVHALLDSPSVTGAYRFEVRPGATLVMDVEATLYPRRSLQRVGIAPLTSMYQHGENDDRMANDWRPEIHDSDGLALWTGGGEWLWRPLTNPAALRYSSFGDDNPRGFGLLQRDRDFDHYQDDGVFYDKRPCLWIEPREGWGAGSIDLVEIPTDDETNDNIVAYWNPAQKLEAGQERRFTYRMHWGAQPPVAPRTARVVATRTGIGGVVGRKRSYFSRRFAVDFAGGDLPLLPRETLLTPVITASRGEVEITSARPLHAIQGVRAMFDLKLTDASTAPVELRLFLSHKGQAMSETWTYQYTPPPPDQRRY